MRRRSAAGTAGLRTAGSFESITMPLNFDWNAGALAEGLRCYEGREFFLAHEHWESVWLKCQQPEKSFLQALIQMAAAFHHLQLNNSPGTASLLRAALRRLESYPAVFHSVRVTPLRENVGAWLRVLAAHDSPVYPPFPQIRFVPPTGEDTELEAPSDRMRAWRLE